MNILFKSGSSSGSELFPHTDLNPPKQPDPFGKPVLSFNKYLKWFQKNKIHWGKFLQLVDCEGWSRCKIYTPGVNTENFFTKIIFASLYCRVEHSRWLWNATHGVLLSVWCHRYQELNILTESVFWHSEKDLQKI